MSCSYTSFRNNSIHLYLNHLQSFETVLLLVDSELRLGNQGKILNTNQLETSPFSSNISFIAFIATSNKYDEEPEGCE